MSSRNSKSSFFFLAVTDELPATLKLRDDQYLPDMEKLVLQPNDLPDDIATVLISSTLYAESFGQPDALEDPHGQLCQLRALVDAAYNAVSKAPVQPGVILGAAFQHHLLLTRGHIAEYHRQMSRLFGDAIDHLSHSYVAYMPNVVLTEVQEFLNCVHPANEFAGMELGCCALLLPHSGGGNALIIVDIDEVATVMTGIVRAAIC